MRARTVCALLALAAASGGCGGKTTLLGATPTKSAAGTDGERGRRTAQETRTVTVTETVTVSATAGPAGTGGGPGPPLLATKNTTRIDGSDPIADAAAVALAVFPSAAPGTHPAAVTLAPTDDWQAAIAAASLMAAPFRAPLLLSGSQVLPAVDVAALARLAPAGAGSLAGTQLIRIGDVPETSGLATRTITGAGPYALAAAIDRFEIAARGKPSVNVMIASADAPAYAMPAAGFAAESGEPILFVSSSGVPPVTAQELSAHGRPHIFVVGPPSVIPTAVADELGRYGPVERVAASATSPAASSVAFAEYRYPPCAVDGPCGHLPRTFGWAIRSPGHGYVLINAARTLDAAAAAALSSRGGYGPQLLIANPSTLPLEVRDYLLSYATPHYTRTGPTTTALDHAWLIGGPQAISGSLQALVDGLLEPVPQQ